MFRKIAASGLLFFLFACSLYGGQTVYLKNGKSIRGKSAWKDGKYLKIKTSTGTLSILYSTVEKVVWTEDSEDNETEKQKNKAGEKKGENSLSTIPEQTENSGKIEVSDENAYRLEEQIRIKNSDYLRSQLAYVYNQLGINEMNKGIFDRAESYFRSAVIYNPNEPLITVNLAQSLFRQEKFYAAKDLLFSAKLEFPSVAGIRVLLSDIYYRENDLQSALEELKTAFTLAPGKILKEKIIKMEQEVKTAGDYMDTLSSHFFVSYASQGKTAVVNDILSALEDAYDRVTRDLDYRPQGRIPVVLYPANDFYELTGSPDWVGGIFDGKIKVPTGGLSRIDNSVKMLLTHELTHALLNSKTKGNCPRWLHEGLAQYEEGKKSRQIGTILHRAVKGSPFNWRGKDDYLPALSFVEYLIEEHSMYSMLRVIDNLSEQNSIEDSFQKVYYGVLKEIREDWIKYLQSRNGK